MVPDTLDVPRIDDVRSAYSHEHVTTRPSRSVAMVSDRGRVRARNEDSGAVAVDGTWAALVVCDGVGSSRNSERASSAAALAGRDALLAAHGRGLAPAEQLTWAMRTAQAAAAMAALDPAGPGSDVPSGDTRVMALPTSATDGSGKKSKPPACTFVAAVAHGPVVTTLSVGDSRAYWIPDAGTPMQLTTDDSFAAMLVQSGKSPEEAARSPYAHVLTAWLGESGPPAEPAVVSTQVDVPGWLVTCSDGLWNYCPTPEHLAAIVRSAPDDASGLAEALVARAKEYGGEDNVTVGVARVQI